MCLFQNALIVGAMNPLVTRLLEQSNDVERNPGPLPHRLIRPGFGSHCNNVINKKLSNKNSNGDMSNGVKIDDLKDSCVDDLKAVIEKQSEQILKQSEEIKLLKTKIDENEKQFTDFRSELSEVRKKWQSMGDLRNG